MSDKGLTNKAEREEDRFSAYLLRLRQEAFPISGSVLDWLRSVFGRVSMPTASPFLRAFEPGSLQVTHLTALVIRHRLPNFLSNVHDERSVPYDGFINWLADWPWSISLIYTLRSEK